MATKQQPLVEEKTPTHTCTHAPVVMRAPTHVIIANSETIFPSWSHHLHVSRIYWPKRFEHHAVATMPRDHNTRSCARLVCNVKNIAITTYDACSPSGTYTRITCDMNCQHMQYNNECGVCVCTCVTSVWTPEKAPWQRELISFPPEILNILSWFIKLGKFIFMKLAYVK